MIKSKWIQKNREEKSLIRAILKNRGVVGEKNIKQFLEPNIQNISNPFFLKDMEKAVERIERAANNREKICIYGDYDVDGITSTSLLINGLKELGIKADFYIPSRDEGYGVSYKSIEELSGKYKLIITVDCGIKSNSEIEYAKELGLDVIVTDHHEIEQLPNCIAINPKREDNVYKFKYLSGVGTAFMLLKALFKAKRVEGVEKFLDLVSIGTIADVMPLTHENRIFVKQGLKLIAKTKNIGLKEIVDSVIKKSEITVRDVNFSIAPLFNAAGRLSHAKIVVELLTTSNIDRAKEIVEELLTLNKTRREIGKKMLDSLDEQKEGEIIVVAERNFHKGLVGIIAARLVDKYNMPAIALKIEGEEAVGSARSTNNFNILEAISECSSLLTRFGGHEKAAGLTIKRENIDLFREKLNKFFKEKSKEIVKEIVIDYELKDFEVNLDLCRQLEVMEPFGKGNEEPIFILRNTRVSNIKKIGKNLDHLMMDIEQNHLFKNAVWFGAGREAQKLKENVEYDIAFKIEENIYMSKNRAKIYVQDIKESKEKICKVDYYKSIYNSAFPKISYITTDYPINQEILDARNISLNDSILQKILNMMEENYFFQFSKSLTKTVELDDKYLSEIKIDKKIEISNNLSKAQKLHSIKKALIGNFEYNEIQKRALRKIIIEGISTTILSVRGRGIDTLALAIAIFIYMNTGKKSLYITEKEDIDKSLKQFFILNSNDGEAPFKFIDNMDLDVKGLFLKFLDKKIYSKKEGAIVDNFEISPNLKIERAKEKGDYHRALKIKDKMEILRKIKSSKEIRAERDILSFL